MFRGVKLQIFNLGGKKTTQNVGLAAISCLSLSHVLIEISKKTQR